MAPAAQRPPRQCLESGLEPAQPVAHHVVVVVAPGVARHLAPRTRRPGMRPGVVDEPHRDDALGSVQDPARVHALLHAPRQVAHLAGVAAREPLAQEGRLRGRFSPGHARQVEAQGQGHCLHAVAERNGKPSRLGRRLGSVCHVWPSARTLSLPVWAGQLGYIPASGSRLGLE